VERRGGDTGGQEQGQGGLLAEGGSRPGAESAVQDCGVSVTLMLVTRLAEDGWRMESKAGLYRVEPHMVKDGLFEINMYAKKKIRNIKRFGEQFIL
jgi:hypothetical protein